MKTLFDKFIGVNRVPILDLMNIIHQTDEQITYNEHARELRILRKIVQIIVDTRTNQFSKRKAFGLNKKEAQN